MVLLKPDAVRRGLVGEIVGRYERKGLRIRAMQLRHVDADLAAEHYAEHLGQPYYPAVEAFITSGPVVALALEGENAIAIVRAMHGATDPARALPGTVRGDYSLSTRMNLVHASDSRQAAQRELSLWFGQDA
ncbi:MULTISPECIES: nucleoside-diphosphate kinase [Propionibacterium]|uniref:nucleoside-diphosphate kinase n=1 Tax=Propionibacterium TaxID=1743 RepID=UPI0006DCB4F3|nr:nucleoside-diphosphate kinase [Propionibacterium freudenreichii]MCT3013004.1 nucleoside-diphosphate kinase [Propionibacterium freudenreichii]MDK9295902.1 nucleoside-diphosphate kinase [Propionibacterium freudenreichii]MDK9332432.1 nucleoside-diphosphate kinase [Propionibacterium freudenreichii]MDK9361293.1 nucleoside-diphosphate kinase [Propionibacterium freudenreichii]MDK9611158.1 nucleoside-diphosphate kinase [Propionibacterium freudenreichii]